MVGIKQIAAARVNKETRFIIAFSFLPGSSRHL
jgi:hypothetical protein